MVLRNALARAAAPLRCAAQAQLSSAGVIGTLAPLARAGAPRHYRNPVENELYDRSRQEYSLGNRVPSVAADAWIAPNATLVGDADVADQCSVWHGAVLKGDLGPVRLGAFSNVQERCHRRRGVRRADPALLSDADRLCARAVPLEKRWKPRARRTRVTLPARTTRGVPEIHTSPRSRDDDRSRDRTFLRVHARNKKKA